MFPIIPANSASASPANTKGIFGFGQTAAAPSAVVVSMTNLVSDAGVVATDTTGVGTARSMLAACEFGNDKGIFGYGRTTTEVSLSNLVSNAGVVATDTTGVGTARQYVAACTFGGDEGIFAFGNGLSNLSNKVSNVGVVASDGTGVGTARTGSSACEYSANKDKGIFKNGYAYPAVNISNLVSNTGVIATDTTGVGTARGALAACEFDSDKCIFAYGEYSDPYANQLSMSNLVSNTGVVASDTTGVGSARSFVGACSYA